MSPELSFPRLLIPEQAEDGAAHEPSPQKVLGQDNNREGNEQKFKVDAGDHEAIGPDGRHYGEQKQGQEPAEVGLPRGAPAQRRVEGRAPLEGEQVIGGELVLDFQLDGDSLSAPRHTDQLRPSALPARAECCSCFA